MAYLHPGVYLEEIPSGNKPIEAVATSDTAFVGKAVKGPVGEAKPVRSFSEYSNLYGDIASEDDVMGLAVRSFYLNGGKIAFICRLAGAGSEAASESVLGQGTGGTATSQPALIVTASSEGAWGNELFFKIDKKDPDSLTFNLIIGHQEKGKFVDYETYDGLSMRAKDDNFALSRVNDDSRYVTLSLGMAADPADVGEQYQNAVIAGGEIDKDNDTYFSSRITAPIVLALNINGLGEKAVTLVPADFSVILAGTNHATDAASLADEIEKAMRALSTEPSYQLFTCTYSTDHFVLTSPKPDVEKDKSLASIEITDGELAEILRIDSKSVAVFMGGSGTSGGAFSGMNYFVSGIGGLTGNPSLDLNIDGLGEKTIELDAAALNLDDDNEEDGNKIALAIQNAVQALDSVILSYEDFKCEYLYHAHTANRRFKLSSGSNAARVSGIDVTGGNLEALLRLQNSQGAEAIDGRSINQGTARVVPVHLTGSPGLPDAGIPLVAGKDFDPTPNDFMDFYDTTLRKVRSVGILILPGQHWASDGSGNPCISASLAHCEKMKNRVIIIDPPPETELEQTAEVTGLLLPSSTYSVLYYPWVNVSNPFYHAEMNPTAAKTIEVAPSAFAAGMWSKIDGKRGVWKAPAGMEARLTGAAGLAFIVDDGEQDRLNPLGVNCFRNMPGGGRVIWGSRTLATRADPEWRYVPVRRTAIMIEQSIYEGIQWAVFEPNDHRLWSSLRANIGNFMYGLFRAGAFQGERASDAYFVRCGLGDTMTQGEINAGQVIVIVGFAPLKPAEFVIVRIQQKVNQQ